MTSASVSAQHAGIQPHSPVNRNQHAFDSSHAHAVKPGVGGLLGHMVAVGVAQNRVMLHMLFSMVRDALGDQRPTSHYDDDPDFSFQDQIEVLNRDKQNHSGLKEAVSSGESQGGEESGRRTEMPQQRDKQVATNRQHAGDDYVSGLARDSSASDAVLQVTQFLQESPNVTTRAQLTLLNNQALLQEFKTKLAALEAQSEQTGFSEEKKRELQDRLKATKARLAEWERSIDTLSTCQASASGGLDVLRAKLTALKARLPSDNRVALGSQHAVGSGRGEARAETLHWATRAKQAFTAFFQPVLSGLAKLGRFVVELPGRIRASLTTPMINAHLNDFLNAPPSEREIATDRRPARDRGTAQHICHGMAIDLRRMEYSIGSHKVIVGSKEDDQLVEEAATALLDLCNGNERLCMDVSYFAFQNVVAFQSVGVQNGWFTPEGDLVSEARLSADQAKDKRLSISRLPDGRIHMLYELENRAMERLIRPERDPIKLDSASSLLTTRFAFVVSERDEGATAPVVKPYPLNPDSGDASAVAYTFRVKVAADQGEYE